MYRSFLELDRMRSVVACRMNDQPDELANEYLRLDEQGHSTVVVSQTWMEVHRVNERVRAALKEKGLLGVEDHLIDALEKIDLTAAEKRDARSYGPGRMIVFNQRIQKFEPGTVAQFVEVLDKGILAEVQDNLVVIQHRNLDRINVCRPLTLPLASGDRLQLKANRKLPGGSVVTNGELVTVRQVRGDGAIELSDGRVLGAGYREFVPGYAVTSYGSQGRTVDYVLRLHDQSRYQRPAMVRDDFAWAARHPDFHAGQRTVARKRPAFRPTSACARTRRVCPPINAISLGGCIAAPLRRTDHKLDSSCSSLPPIQS